MPPPQQSSISLQEKLIQLAQTLQFAWFFGHLTLLLSIISYSFSYLTFNFYSRLAIFAYRTAFFSAAATYGIVVYKAFRARARAAGRPVISPLSLIADENVQYLGMALVWLWSSHYPLAMLPFGIYSIFHIATYTRTVLVPMFLVGSSNNSSSSSKAAPNSSAAADTIGRFVKKYYDASMGLVASLEIALWGRILLSAIIFTKGSWILLAIYSIFLRARYAQSSFVQSQVRTLEARIDGLVGSQSIPIQARQAWEIAKNGVRKFFDATSINKFIVGGSSAPRKTT